MSNSDVGNKKPIPTFSRPWIERFPYEALTDRDQNPEIADADLRAFVPDGCMVAYVDELKRTHVLEARAYGLTSGRKPLVIGFQVEHGRVKEQLWKAVERIDRIFVLERDIQFVERTIPPQHAGRLAEIIALAPQTGLDLTEHAAYGY